MWRGLLADLLLRTRSRRCSLRLRPCILIRVIDFVAEIVFEPISKRLDALGNGFCLAVDGRADAIGNPLSGIESPFNEFVSVLHWLRYDRVNNALRRPFLYLSVIVFGQIRHFLLQDIAETLWKWSTVAGTVNQICIRCHVAPDLLQRFAKGADNRKICLFGKST